MVTDFLRWECHVRDCPTRIVVQCGSNERQPRSTSSIRSPPETAATGFGSGFSADLDFSADVPDFSADFGVLFSPVLAPLDPPAFCDVSAFCAVSVFSPPPFAARFAREPQPAAATIRSTTSAATTPCAGRDLSTELG